MDKLSTEQARTLREQSTTIRLLLLPPAGTGE